MSKAGGDNGLLPDLLKCCGGAWVNSIVTVFTTMLCIEFYRDSAFLSLGYVSYCYCMW